MRAVERTATLDAEVVAAEGFVLAPTSLLRRVHCRRSLALRTLDQLLTETQPGGGLKQREIHIKNWLVNGDYTGENVGG